MNNTSKECFKIETPDFILYANGSCVFDVVNKIALKYGESFASTIISVRLF